MTITEITIPNTKPPQIAFLPIKKEANKHINATIPIKSQRVRLNISYLLIADLTISSIVISLFIKPASIAFL